MEQINAGGTETHMFMIMYFLNSEPNESGSGNTVVAYLSFDVRWVRLQFKFTGNILEQRCIYGATIPNEWTKIK